MTFQMSLWMVDVVAKTRGTTQARPKPIMGGITTRGGGSITDAIKRNVKTRMDNLFLAPCVGGQITSAVSEWRQHDVAFTPGAQDAVVFVVTDVGASLGTRLGRPPKKALTSQTILGTTFLGQAGGDIAEVYFDRCFNDEALCNAIFHEAAHLKSNIDDKMHTFFTPGVGGAGVRVLAGTAYSMVLPSFDDIEFFTQFIPRAAPLRSTAPP